MAGASGNPDILRGRWTRDQNRRGLGWPVCRIHLRVVERHGLHPRDQTRERQHHLWPHKHLLGRHVQRIHGYLLGGRRVLPDVHRRCLPGRVSHVHSQGRQLLKVGRRSSRTTRP